MIRRIAAGAAILTISIITPTTAQAHQPTVKQCSRTATLTHNGGGINAWRAKRAKCIKHSNAHRCNPTAPVRTAIRCAFGRHANAALRVAYCESRYNTNARNGQYLGIFQMGSAERARFGHSNNALGQARAARRYFNLAGWRPWACQP